MQAGMITSGWDVSKLAHISDYKKQKTLNFLRNTMIAIEKLDFSRELISTLHFLLLTLPFFYFLVFRECFFLLKDKKKKYE